MSAEGRSGVREEEMGRGELYEELVRKGRELKIRSGGTGGKEGI